jgi:hypothetical protein
MQNPLEMLMSQRIHRPGGTAVTTAYQSETADALSRPDQVREHSAVLASMEFLGPATLVGLDYEAASHARLAVKSQIDIVRDYLILTG